MEKTNSNIIPVRRNDWELPRFYDFLMWDDNRKIYWFVYQGRVFHYHNWDGHYVSMVFHPLFDGDILPSEVKFHVEQYRNGDIKN